MANWRSVSPNREGSNQCHFEPEILPLLQSEAYSSAISAKLSNPSGRKDNSKLPKEGLVNQS